MRIGHFQADARAGDFDANLAKFVEGMERADRERVEICCFPELFLTGVADDAERARAHAFAVDSPAMGRTLAATQRFGATAVVGFGEMRDNAFYNAAAVIEAGKLLGVYRKASAYETWEHQGREFPVFERGHARFGVIICSDGGYIEPARILSLKGAKIIFAPHYNYINKEYLLEHYRTVRSDHTARAVENTVYFVRGNNYHVGRDPGIQKADGVGYGDSYIVDPFGEILVRARQFAEDFIFADVDLNLAKTRAHRSLWSHRELGKILDQAAGAQ